MDMQEEYELFQRQVKESRPDIDFTFENLITPGSPRNFCARWTFPGARTGGELSGGHVGWLFGTHTLCWGVEHKDIEAWIEFEKQNGREPRFT